MFAKLFGLKDPIFAEAPVDQVFLWSRLWESAETSREGGLSRVTQHCDSRAGVDGSAVLLLSVAPRGDWTPLLNWRELQWGCQGQVEHLQLSAPRPTFTRWGQ